jgi:hypothetical protein
MLADSIPAALLALTETSAHPASKSSFNKRLHDPTPTQKRPYLGAGAALCPLGVKVRRTQSEHKVFRITPESGHCLMRLACLKRACALALEDFVTFLASGRGDILEWRRHLCCGG